jgi:hypothetical protein
LHYVFDLWIKWWRKQCHGDVVLVRYADDFVIGFQSRDDAEVCLKELQERFAKFGLKLHPKKTRLIEFGRYAMKRRQRDGDGRPETFDFLGVHSQVCPDSNVRLVHGSSSFDGQADASDVSEDQRVSTATQTSPDRRNGPLVATRCSRLVKLPRRSEQQSTPVPLR